MTRNIKALMIKTNCLWGHSFSMYARREGEVKQKRTIVYKGEGG